MYRAVVVLSNTTFVKFPTLILTASAVDGSNGAEMLTVPLASSVMLSRPLPPETVNVFAGLAFQLKCNWLTCFGEPKSIVILAVVFASGCQVVALLPSMAASAYCPGTVVAFVPMVKEVSVSLTTVLHCARSRIQRYVGFGNSRKKCVLTTSDKSAIRGPCRNDERLPNFQ